METPAKDDGRREEVPSFVQLTVYGADRYYAKNRIITIVTNVPQGKSIRCYGGECLMGLPPFYIYGGRL